MHYTANKVESHAVLFYFFESRLSNFQIFGIIMKIGFLYFMVLFGRNLICAKKLLKTGINIILWNCSNFKILGKHIVSKILILNLFLL